MPSSESVEARVRLLQEHTRPYLEKCPYDIGEILMPLLQEESAEVRKQFCSDPNLFSIACANEEREFIDYMISHCGVDLEQCEEEGTTPLWYSTYYGQETLVEFLAARGANVNWRVPEIPKSQVGFSNLRDTAKRGLTPLHVACLHTDVNMVTTLLEKGADPNLVDHTGTTCLMVSFTRWIYDLLLDAGANLDAQDHSGQTVLHRVIERYDLDLAEWLLLQGADVFIHDGQNEHVLQTACRMRDDKAVDLLLEHRGALYDLKDLAAAYEVCFTGDSSWHPPASLWESTLEISTMRLNERLQASSVHLGEVFFWLRELLLGLEHISENESGKVNDSLKLVIKVLTQLDQQPREGTPDQDEQRRYDLLLQLFVSKLPASPGLEMRRMLFEFMKSASCLTSSGESLLHLNMKFGPDLTRILLECGANVNGQTKNGDTPLHYALQPKYYKPKTVDLLLEHGAEFDSRNAQNESTINGMQAVHGANMMQLMKLKCLASRAVAEHNLSYKGEVPDTLIDHIKLH